MFLKHLFLFLTVRNFRFGISYANKILTRFVWQLSRVLQAELSSNSWFRSQQGAALQQICLDLFLLSTKVCRRVAGCSYITQGDF
jgi:hypothetical protein